MGTCISLYSAEKLYLFNNMKKLDIVPTQTQVPDIKAQHLFKWQKSLK